MKLSAAIATYNEEDNIADCLRSIENMVDEIVIVDGSSTDKTVEIAKSFNAKVEIRGNPPIFHINKQRSFDIAKGEWILYLDADERVSKPLAEEIKRVINMDNRELELYQLKVENNKLFTKHQRLLQHRDGLVGTNNGVYVAFFVPRLNYFLGKYLRYGGLYPDGVIRLFKNKKAYLPCKSVHEQMVVLGKVGWLKHDLLHIDSPNFGRYLERNSRYINLIKQELIDTKVGKDLPQFMNYCFIKPIYWFLLTQLRHKGILDGIPGIIFSLFSALRYPRAYIRYLYD